MPHLTLPRILLLLVSTLPLATATAPFAGRHPMITPSPNLLEKRQQNQCAASSLTLCPSDGGCCPIDSPCTTNSLSQPICASATCASPAVLCNGAYSNLCCNAGSSCASDGICTATPTGNGGFSVPTFTSHRSASRNPTVSPAEETNMEDMPMATGGVSTTAAAGEETGTTSAAGGQGTGAAVRGAGEGGVARVALGVVGLVVGGLV